MPDWAHGLATRFKDEGLTSDLLDYLLINDYETGSRHPLLTSMRIWSATTIVSISLGSTCIMEFTDTQSDDKAALLLEPLSALVLSGEARHRWQHAIPPRMSDEWMGRTLNRTTARLDDVPNGAVEGATREPRGRP